MLTDLLGVTDDRANAFQRIYRPAIKEKRGKDKSDHRTGHGNDRFKYLLTCLQTVGTVKNMVKLKCQRCKHIWNYKGKKKHYVSCGNSDCKTSVTIRKATVKA